MICLFKFPEDFQTLSYVYKFIEPRKTSLIVFPFILTSSTSVSKNSSAFIVWHGALYLLSRTWYNLKCFNSSLSQRWPHGQRVFSGSGSRGRQFQCRFIHNMQNENILSISKWYIGQFTGSYFLYHALKTTRKHAKSCFDSFPLGGGF